MRFVRMPMIGVFLLIALVVGMMIISTNQEPATASPADTPSSYPPGAPAIVPHNNARTGAAGISTSGIAEADVSNFVATRGFVGGVVMPGAKITIGQVQCMTAKEVSALMGGEVIGRPDNTLVCLVKLKGPFLLTNKHVPPSFGPNQSTQTPEVSQEGAMIFDATTGNLLIWSAN